jgi:hypothetical protein
VSVTALNNHVQKKHNPTRILSVTETFPNVVEATNESLKPPAYPTRLNKTDFDPWPILQLQILFKQLVLFPTDKSSDRKRPSKAVNATIHERLRKFKQGKLSKSYEESRQVTSKTPKQQAASPVKVQRVAQVAADLDNFKSANASVTKHAPVGLINDSICMYSKICIHSPSSVAASSPKSTPGVAAHCVSSPPHRKMLSRYCHFSIAAKPPESTAIHSTLYQSSSATGFIQPNTHIPGRRKP